MAQLADSECWSTGIVFHLSCPRAAFHCVPLKGDSQSALTKSPASNALYLANTIHLPCSASHHSLSLSLKRMVLVNCPTKIASLLPHISPMHPKAMLSKMGISMMYAAQKARNIGSVVLSLLSRTPTPAAQANLLLFCLSVYM